MQNRLFYVVFEDLVREPQRVLREVLTWLGLAPAEIDTAHLKLQPVESDSYYRFKYPHRVRASIEPPVEHRVSERIVGEIRKHYRWYYQTFYRGLLEG
jgi:sulfotransferase